MESIVIQPSILYFGTPVVLITTRNPDGSSNISPMSSAWALGKRVILGLSVAGQGFANLEREGECVLNIPSGALWAQVERLAPTTGRNPVPSSKQGMGYRFVADKFAEAGLTPLPCECIQPPRIAECPLQLEARLLNVYPFDTRNDPNGHLNECHIVEVGVVRVHAHQDVVLPNSNHINTERFSPLWYVFRHYFGEARDLEKNFRAEV
jgi:flavin reductase (DIM6/NTAB) family NADH-FMN oxidoreductase RutF